MNIYFAPMEGITDGVFRRLHHKYFPGIDRYYMPFLSPTVHRCLTNREARELPAADSVDFTAIPQLLGKNPEDLAWAAEQCAQLGYREVNVNLGCPSGTVVAKGKGAGMLADPEGLDRFLDELFSATNQPLSIKTRIGLKDPEEFPRLLEIYNQYPIVELTVHPRVRTAFYKGPCSLDAFEYAVENAKMPLCYNGDICSLEELAAMRHRFPQVQSVMVGRGLVGNPGLFSGGTKPEVLEVFLDELLETYCCLFGSRRNTMFRMKEHWFYLLRLFRDSEKLGKQLRKTTDYDAFRALTRQIIHTLPMRGSMEPFSGGTIWEK